jgi:hypothetical protein
MSFSGSDPTQGTTVTDVAVISISGLSGAWRSILLALCDSKSLGETRLSGLLLDIAAASWGADIRFALYYVALRLGKGQDPRAELGDVVIYANRRSVP